MMDPKYILLIVIATVCAQPVALKNMKKKCETCREVIKNFQKGMDKTQKANFGGGDTAWEERKLGTFAKSETRLLEILENICEGIDKESQCHAMIEKHEEDIENWWFKKFGTSAELEAYLCVDTIKVCCPKGKYGKKCKECLGGESNPCNGHGTCKGDGTRVGNGTCSCEEAYQGDACDQCKEGYSSNEDKSCTDINECSNGEASCSEDEYCENQPGTYECQQCPTQCTTCYGPTMKECTNCKEGYRLDAVQGGCVDVNECEESDSHDLCSPEHICANKNGSYACVIKGPEGYKYGDDDFFYSFHDENVTWSDAKDGCANEGGWLAAITTEEVMKFTKSEYGAKRMWIGANDLSEEGKWMWARDEDGSVDTTYWETDEPNGKEDSNCVVTNWNSAGKWNDDTCDSLHPYLCQYAHSDATAESTSEDTSAEAATDAASDEATENAHDAAEL